MKSSNSFGSRAKFTKKMSDNFDVIIIGGGAAGMMAAITAAEVGRHVLVIEHNKRCGRKLLITGKGRCNVTNNCDNRTLMNNIPKNSRFLYSAFSQFSTQDTMDFFERLGVPLKTERGNRVFPVSDKAMDIVDTMVGRMKKLGVRVQNEKAQSLIIENGEVRGVKTDIGEYRADKVIIATGGKSYPATGSDGSGYALARQAGHTVTPLSPSLIPIVTEESYAAEMMGLSLKNVTLSVFDRQSGKEIFKEMGEMLFTHFGVSGPLVLSASSHIREIEPHRYELRIDLKPALDEQTLDKRLQREFAENSNKQLSNVMRKLLPEKMVDTMVKLSGINPETKVNEITREQRQELVKLLKCLKLTAKGFRPIDEAIITSGGVDVKEINPKTMESKLVNGLYFAGEIIDCDAYTGGFNLQIAFSTGFVAANL